MIFTLQCDHKARVLVVTFREFVTDASFLAGFAALKDFVDHRGLHHVITDLSPAESIELSNELLTLLGSMAPAFPASVRRIVVASAPAAYVCARIVQKLRADSAAPMEIVATTEEAYSKLGICGSDLVEVQP